MEIEIYSSDRKKAWDEFVARSKNGTFLFLRDYMEYHRDIFFDHSVLIWADKGRLAALLPANKSGTDIVAHGGLTHGGFITDSTMTVPQMLDIFEGVMGYLAERHFEKLCYKTIPYIYHKLPSEEDRYALFLSNARLVRRDVLTVIDNNNRLPFQQRRCRNIAKAVKAGFCVGKTEDFETYWAILMKNLKERFNASPVHNLKQIRLLHSRFPSNIKLYACFDGNVMQGGVVIYESDRVARVQYISASERGKDFGAIDMIFDNLLNTVYRNRPFIDFGGSNENNGLALSKGLIDQKEGFGGRAVVQDHYEIIIAEWQPGLCRRAIR